MLQQGRLLPTKQPHPKHMRTLGPTALISDCLRATPEVVMPTTLASLSTARSTAWSASLHSQEGSSRELQAFCAHG